MDGDAGGILLDLVLTEHRTTACERTQGSKETDAIIDGNGGRGGVSRGASRAKHDW